MNEAPRKVVFDFAREWRRFRWTTINDGVMGGISSSNFEITPEDTAVFSGTVRLENSGGFASVRAEMEPVDCRRAEGFRIRARGDGRTYKVTVRNDLAFDSPLHQARFATRPGEWLEVFLPFREFVPSLRGRLLDGAAGLDPANVASIGFLISDKQAGPFRLEVAQVQACTGDEA